MQSELNQQMAMIMNHDKKENVLKQRIKQLEDDILNLTARSSKRETQLLAEKASVIRQAEEEKVKIGEQKRQLQDMTEIELRVKDQIVAQLMRTNSELHKKVEHLETMLKIPRHHYKYLEEHGMLEEFVKAKMEENDDAARLALNHAMEIGESKRAPTTSKNNTWTVESIHKRHASQHQSMGSPRIRVKLAQKRRSLMLHTELGFTQTKGNFP